MAKAARFGVGTSGSGKHTETRGDGSQLGGRGPAESGPRIGPGVEKNRVRPEYDRSSGPNSGAMGGKMRRYSEE